jgi:hypothetical protein
VDFTPTEIARIPSSAPRSIEPEATPSAAATPAVSGLALPQLAAASPAAPAATPQRHASRAAQAAADMPRNSVALAELANTETLERASVETLPESQGKRALAIRDAANTAQPATAAAPLALQDAGAGVPSSSSRALGSPSRPTQQRSLGALAASEASSSVAQAASARDEAPVRQSADVSLDGTADARAALAARAQSALAGAESSVASSAAAGSSLALSDLAGSGLGDGNLTEQSGGPARGSVSSGRRADAAAALASASLAQRSAQLESDTGTGRERGTPALAAPLGSAASDTAALQSEIGAEVSARASQAPGLALGSLEARTAEQPRSDQQGETGPARVAGASVASTPVVPSAGTAQPLVSRAQAPSEGVARQANSAVPDAASRGERSIALEDAPASVAQAASAAAGDQPSPWLADLGAAPAERARESGGAPSRATTTPGAAAAAAPLASNAPTLERPAAPTAREPTPARAPTDWDATPYQNRSGAEKARALELYGGSERTEAAVAKGLEYLAGIQRRNGAWGDVRAVDEKYGRVAVGKTALCTLAFLGAGHTQNSKTEHSAVVSRAIEFLLSVQDAGSGHFGESSAYDHGISTYALAECFALTKDERLRAPLERAIAHVLAMQSTRQDARFSGGWGYYESDGSHYDPWPRTSITAWQVMALESARLSGLSVPDQAFEAVREFLTKCEDTRLGAYRYNHDPERLGSAYPTLPASTPAALFALALLGEDIASSRHQVARDYVLERAPDGYRYTGEADFVALARGNPYFWYYGTLAMFRVGGSGWQRWNMALQESLLPAQARDGSWKPIDVYARYALDSASDKSYTTALCVLSLEVYYRYYLPLLKVR